MHEKDVRERALRKKLGIPGDAQRVIVFAESSHWDPDWLLTAGEYYRLRVRRILDDMVRWLEKEPGRVYSVECVFFLRMYWDRHPEKRDKIRTWVNEGRIRLSGSGINTPDTILPELEALIRDYLHGQEWLRENGMHQEPRLAYLPDNFGHTPWLPSILRSLGYEYCAFSRIDGILFPGSEYLSARRYPLSGSTAETLLRDHRSADFVWKNADGSRVLCHLNPRTYGQGDLIAHAAIARWMGLVIGLPFPALDSAGTARRISGYVRELEGYARTPYLFCPIGFDFNPPLPHLLERIGDYNERFYPHTGVFAINASLEDYMDLVSTHLEELPVLEIDPNPYFMGFYSSRPEAKQLHRETCAMLTLAEKLWAEKEWGSGTGPEEEAWRELERTWDAFLMSNHHDFITGTSPQRVWDKEQKPLLDACAARARGILVRASSSRRGGRTPDLGGPCPEWSMDRGVLDVETPSFHLRLDESVGGCITRWRDKSEGLEMLSGPANDLVSYEDRGGLWRMGHEYRGGIFREKARASESSASITVSEEGGCLVIRVESLLEGHALVRRLWVSRDHPVVRMSVEGTMRADRTVTCLFNPGFRPEGITMDTTGGVVERPLVKLYRPTFWAAKRFAFVTDPSRRAVMAAFLGGPATVGCDPERGMELVALRTARMERAWRVVPLLAHPAAGKRFGVQRLDYAVLFAPSGDWTAGRLHVLSRRLPYAGRGDETWRGPTAFEDVLFSIDSEEVEVLAFKRSRRGEGMILRLYSPLPHPDRVTVSLGERGPAKAWLCDARERDLEELEVRNGEVSIPLRGNITTIRLLP